MALRDIEIKLRDAEIARLRSLLELTTTNLRIAVQASQALRSERDVARETLEEIDQMPYMVTNDSESLRFTIKTIQQISSAALSRLSSPGDLETPPFKPCVMYHEDICLTEMVLEDTLIIWQPWGPYKGHAVDCGYTEDGRLVVIKIWDDVRTRASPGAQQKD